MAVLALVLGVAGPLAGAAHAQDRTERITFAGGRTSKTVSDTITGYVGVNYLVRVRDGQRLAVSIKTDNPGNYFNIFGPQSGEAIFNGSVSGDMADVIVDSGGDYRVQVYLMRNAARRGERANFRLTVEVTGGDPSLNGAPSDPDFADGLAGGPDFWEVANVPAGDRLNIRSSPSSRSQVVARVRNGTVLRNLGCRMNGQTRWCRVERPDGSDNGWAAGRYLIESSGQ